MKGLINAVKNGLVVIVACVSVNSFATCYQDGGPWSTISGLCYNANQDLYWSDDTGKTLGYGINWTNAKNYCIGLGGRVPTSQEMYEAYLDDGDLYLDYGYGPGNLRWTTDTNGKSGKKLRVITRRLDAPAPVDATQTSQLYTFCVFEP